MDYRCECLPGFEGSTCEKSDPERQPVQQEDEWVIQVILGVVIGVSALIILIGTEGKFTQPTKKHFALG